MINLIEVERIKRIMSHDCLKESLRLISEVEFQYITKGKFVGFKIKQHEYENFLREDKDIEDFIKLFTSLNYKCFIENDEYKRLYILPLN